MREGPRPWDTPPCCLCSSTAQGFREGRSYGHQLAQIKSLFSNKGAVNTYLNSECKSQCFSIKSVSNQIPWKQTRWQESPKRSDAPTQFWCRHHRLPDSDCAHKVSAATSCHCLFTVSYCGLGSQRRQSDSVHNPNYLTAVWLVNTRFQFVKWPPNWQPTNSAADNLVNAGIFMYIAYCVNNKFID